MKLGKLFAFLLLVICIATVAVSCKSTNHEVALSQNKGVVGKNGIARPDWVIYDQSNEEMHYASGYGTGVTFDIAKQKAQLNADADIALWISNAVQTVRERYVEDNVVNDTEKYIDKFVSKATQNGQALLSGVTEIDFWEDKDGGVWVLRCIPVANIKAQIESAIASTCADASLFSDSADIAGIKSKLNAALEESFAAK